MDSAGLEGGAVRRWSVSSREAGVRIDAFLAARLGVSRAEARRWLARGSVAADGRRLGAHHKGMRLAEGSAIEVRAFAPEGSLRPIAQPEWEPTVLAEGPGWIALDKPPGVPVHPLEPAERGTLLNALIAFRPEVFGVGEGGLRSGVLHRLDVDTSGVVLFALEASAWQRLRQAFQAHRVEKRYRTLVQGRLVGEGHELVALEVAQHRPARVRVRPAGLSGGVGRRAELSWRALEELGGATLVEVRPVTGFLHQIRATLAARGHPVVGDRVYGDRRHDPFLAHRHLLHAAAVRFESIEARSPDPPDWIAALDALRSPPDPLASGDAGS